MAWHSWRTDALVDVEILRNLRKEIENLVHDGCLQEVCHLLSDFGSKIRIKVTHILLATYPAAIKEAVRLIDGGKMEKARLVVMEVAVLLAPVEAERDLVVELVAEKAPTNDERAQIAKLLTDAGRQIRLAEAFGSGQPANFKDLKRHIVKLSNGEKASESVGSGMAALTEQLKEIFPSALAEKVSSAKKSK